MRPHQRLAAALALAALMSAACGARLTPAQRTEALNQTGGGAVLNGSAGGGPADGTGGASTPTARSTPGGGPGGAGTTGSTGQVATTGSTGKAGTPATTGSTGSTGTTGGASSGSTGGTVLAPPGGNGGATDTGVTKDAIVIGNVSDISGAVPGLFEDAQLAVKAYVAYFNAREKTIYGRKLQLLALDSRLDSGANRSASIQECDQAFAGVGSVSAFDQGGAPVIRDCGIPDMRGLATTDQMKAVPNVYPINAAGTGGSRSMAVFGWAKERFPDAVKKAAYIYIDGDVTRQLEQQDAEGARQTLGYDWIYEPAVGIQETNYGPVVQQMKSKGVRYVTFVGAYQQAASLVQAMKQQSFTPDVFQPTVTAYTPAFIKQAGAAAEGTYVAVVPSLIEEMAGNPELTLYAQWLNQVQPGASPTGIGQYAWAAASLFVEKAKKIGPNLTRKALLAELATVHSYDGNGLFPAQDVGGRRLSSCTQIVQVKGGKFVRLLPAAPRAIRCVDPIWNTKTKQAEKGFPQ